MPPESRKLLSDMLAAAQAINDFMTGKSRDDLSKDDQLRSSVYFKFIIIGEALAQLRQHDSDTAEQISEYWRIIGFRNQIIHGYGHIEDPITWRIIQAKLPVLISELTAMLR